MTVGQKIKSYLSVHKITQASVSEVTGIPPAKLNMSLNGNRGLTIDEYSLIIYALGVTADKFIEPLQPSSCKTSDTETS